MCTYFLYISACGSTAKKIVGPFTVSISVPGKKYFTAHFGASELSPNELLIGISKPVKMGTLFFSYSIVCIHVPKVHSTENYGLRKNSVGCLLYGI